MYQNDYRQYQTRELWQKEIEKRTDEATPLYLSESNMADDRQTASFGTRPLSLVNYRPAVPKEQTTAPCWLVMRHTRRHIFLPTGGTVILGRIDPRLGSNNPLDIDLTCYDQGTATISRRHAQIVSAERYHTIEDIGSSNGLFINEVRAVPTHPYRLKPGDKVALGEIQMFYEPVPEKFLALDASEMTKADHFLICTYSGHKIPLMPNQDIVIGRADPTAEFVPHIDMSQEGDMTWCVSRHHMQIIWKKHKPHLGDLGSSYGTRYRGKKLFPNRLEPLNPGDHISLGGYIVAYDIEL